MTNNERSTLYLAVSLAAFAISRTTHGWGNTFWFIMSAAWMVLAIVEELMRWTEWYDKRRHNE